LRHLDLWVYVLARTENFAGHFSAKEDAMTDILDGLRIKAEQMAVSDDLTRRPTWAPRLLLSEELLTLLYELEWLGGDDKATGRLWARFTDPRRGMVRCEGFELRAGETHAGGKIFTAQYFDKALVMENAKRNLEQCRPELRPHFEDVLRKMEGKTGGWDFGPHWIKPRKTTGSWAIKYPKYVRARELGQARVTDFAGEPEGQMRAAGRYFGHCCCCGKALTDPQSIELGIGPECRHRVGVTAATAPGPWIIGGTNEEDLPF
jgi:hypothetical protein